MLIFSRYQKFISSVHESLDSLVTKCSSMSQLKTLHAQIILRGLAGDAILVSKLISFSALSSFGEIDYADYLFDKIPHPNRHMYNTLIRASVNMDTPSKAVSLYRNMVSSGIFPNEFTFPFILKACALLRAYLDGVSVHLHALKLGFSRHICVQNGVINFYSACGNIELSRQVFSLMEFRTLVSWNSMIGCFAKMGKCEEAFLFLKHMIDEGIGPDGHTFVSLLSVCSRINNVELGKCVHWYVIVNGILTDVHLQNALLDMYSKCGYLQMAEAVFITTINKNVVTWTSMVSSYARSGSVELAESIFDQMPMKNVVSWNSMITCYLQNGYFKESLECFDRMLSCSIVPDETTIVSLLSACGQLGDLITGQKLHNYLFGIGMNPSIISYNALIDMYSKCGCLQKAMDVFIKMPEKNVVSWNSIINALAFHGSGTRAVELFQMMETNGIKPDAVTFNGLLSACCHSGLTETGKLVFHKMYHMYGIPHEIEHYSCMIDILGRGGFFKEALKLIGEMPMKPDTVIWGALLGGCRIHRNVAITKLILKQLLEMEPYSAGVYVLVCNIFCESEHRDEMKKMWNLIDRCCVWKNTAVSCVEISGRVYEFMVDEMKKMWNLIDRCCVWKNTAVSCVEISGRVYEFMVDDKKHEESSFVYMILDQLKNHLSAELDAFNFNGEIIATA